jgi:hypothetical protein
MHQESDDARVGYIVLLILVGSVVVISVVVSQIKSYSERAREAERQRLQQARQELEQAKTDCESGPETPTPSGLKPDGIERLVVATRARAEIVFGGSGDSKSTVRVLKQPYPTIEQLRQLLGEPTITTRSELGGTCVFGDRGPGIPEIVYEWGTRYDPRPCQLGLEQKRKTHYSSEFTAVFRPSAGPGLWCVQIDGRNETIGRSTQDWSAWEKRRW